MAGPEPPDHGVKSLRDAIVATGANMSQFPPPRHLLTRLATLIAGEPVEYVDSSLQPSDNGGYDGQLLVVTPTRFVLAKAHDAPFQTDAFHPERARATSVTARSWSRATLNEVAMADDNPNEIWQNALSTEWPRGAHLHLRFRNDPDPITLPLSDATLSYHSDLGALLRALLADLAQARPRD
jgi:hypothetical protein